MAVVCDIRDPLTRQPYSRDPRFVAHKAEAHLARSGVADTSFWGPEVEFYIFNSVRFDQNAHEGYYYVDSDEGIWNSGSNGTANLGWRPRHKEGYFPLPAESTSFRTCAAASSWPWARPASTSRSTTTRSAPPARPRSTCASRTTGQDGRPRAALQVHRPEHLQAHGYTATFMPKPLFGDNGSGMHTHQSLWKDGVPLFYDKDGYALFSDLGRWYIGGLLKHAPAVLAFAAPTTNSYRRLVPGYEAPIKLAYSARNRSACVRIPTYSDSPKARRLEFRSPDPTCNPYLAFSAMLMAGLDGIANKIEPPAPIEMDLYELEGEQADQVKDLPGSLPEVLDALEDDHSFLLKGGVFTRDLIDNYISYKREREVDPVALRPHPYEFFLYYDA